MLEKLKDSAMAGANATVNGLAHAGAVTHQPQIDSATANHISDTVEVLVKELLDKSYFNETCLAIYTQIDFDVRDISGKDLTELKQACLAFWKQRGIEALRNE